jgi:c-di-AMP phosphodiesterase-like protein
LWRVWVTILHWKQNSAFDVIVVLLFVIIVVFVVAAAVVVEIHFPVNCIKILTVAQHCSYGKFILPETMQIIRTNI